MHRIHIIYAFILITQHMLSQGVMNYYHSDVHCPTIHPKDARYGGPYYELNSDTPLLFEFDLFTEVETELIYSIEHCNPLFIPDGLDAMDCIQGFNENRIPYPTNSLNTLQAYDHYQFELPNEMTQFRISGNYRVTIYNNDLVDMDDAKSPIAILYFTVFENRSNIQAQINASSEAGFRFFKQEVDLKIIADQLPNSDRDKLQIAIIQNQDFLNGIYIFSPTFTPSFSEFQYDYSDGRNSFWGGGEYRMFEFKNPRVPCYGIAKIEDQQIYLQTEISENARSYASRKDINGNYYVATDNQELSFDDQLNADYFTVHFSLSTPSQEQGKMFLECSGIANKYEPAIWNPELEKYEATAYLKQGVYSYRFVMKDTNGHYIPYSEGNHYETENDYTVLVYGYNRNWGAYGCYGLKKFNSGLN
ncbi:MAG: DUF5103 domain-containing protein [Bacteroidetes bacterium]|nr:DUF5103 domain-containing protein [Bacteroidota bacterium]